MTDGKALLLKVTTLADNLFSLGTLHLTIDLKVIEFFTVRVVTLISKNTLVVRGRLSDSFAEPLAIGWLRLVLLADDNWVLESFVLVGHLHRGGNLWHRDTRMCALLRRATLGDNRDSPVFVLHWWWQKITHLLFLAFLSRAKRASELELMEKRLLRLDSILT